ncbi:MAG: hypothetical protein JSS43_11565, partial [Proteobacteria bacterium]|nr:hypothetical protein [Pseudomonadota bacterium]
ELGLIAEIIGFRYKALGLIRDSEHPDLPIGAVLQLMKTANALRRNEAAAQRKLDALRRARLAEQATAPAAEAEPPPPPPPEPVQPPQATAPAEAPQAAAATPDQSAGIHAFLQHSVHGQIESDDPAQEAEVDDLFLALRHDIISAAPRALNGTGSPRANG